jgi:sec-independent protein translocase protein TatA
LKKQDASVLHPECQSLRGHPALCDNKPRDCAAARARRAEDETMGDLLQPWHLIVLAVVAFLLFGAKRLPELGKGLGEGLKGFKEGIRGISDPTPPTPPAQQQNVAPPPPTSTPIEPK